MREFTTVFFIRPVVQKHPEFPNLRRQHRCAGGSATASARVETVVAALADLAKEVV